MIKSFSLLLFLCATALAAQNTGVPAAAPQADAPPAPGAAVAPAPVVEPPAKKNEPQPWRLGKALSFPEWLSMGLNHRSRYENLTNQFRSGSGISGDQPVYALRSLFSLGVRWNQLALKTELIDSRVYFAAPGTPLDTTFVDTFDILQAHAELRFPGLFAERDELRFTGGRYTMDLGSRRLVARNRFRNTINAFTGIDSEYKFASDDRLRLFVNLPVQRLPDTLAELQANRSRLDYETQNVVFAGAVHENRSFFKPVVAEFYALGLSENDTPDLLTRNRRLVTPGLRTYLPAKPDSFDFEFEGAVQTGRSRATSRATDNADLEHLAWFVHASTGYTARLLGQTRFSVEYQYASGNASSNAGKTGRFDPLFGARRFMFGPTSLYGAIALSNINTPGVRVEIRPMSAIKTFLAYRYVQLAESSDAWTTSGLADKTGNSGVFLGQQVEGEIIWNILPGNLSIEGGFAYFSLGSFAKSLRPAMQDPVYVFMGMVLEL